MWDSVEQKVCAPQEELCQSLNPVAIAIVTNTDLGWGTAAITGCFALTVAATAVLLAWSSSAAKPLIDLRFFRSLPFSGAAVTAIAGICGFSEFLFPITLYLQEVRGYSALTAGLFLVPVALVMAYSTPLCGRVIAAHGTRILLLGWVNAPVTISAVDACRAPGRLPPRGSPRRVGR